MLGQDGPSPRWHCGRVLLPQYGGEPGRRAWEWYCQHKYFPSHCLFAEHGQNSFLNFLFDSYLGSLWSLLLQAWMYTNTSELRHSDDLCLDSWAAVLPGDVHLERCHGMHGNQEWIFSEADGTVRHKGMHG